MKSIGGAVCNSQTNKKSCPRFISNSCTSAGTVRVVGILVSPRMSISTHKEWKPRPMGIAGGRWRRSVLRAARGRCGARGPGSGGAPLSGRGVEAVGGLAAGRFGFFSGLLCPRLSAPSAGHHGEAGQPRGEYPVGETEGCRGAGASGSRGPSRSGRRPRRAHLRTPRPRALRCACAVLASAPGSAGSASPGAARPAAVRAAAAERPRPRRHAARARGQGMQG